MDFLDQLYVCVCVCVNRLLVRRISSIYIVNVCMLTVIIFCAKIESFHVERRLTVVDGIDKLMLAGQRMLFRLQLTSTFNTVVISFSLEVKNTQWFLRAKPHNFKVLLLDTDHNVDVNSS